MYILFAMFFMPLTLKWSIIVHKKKDSIEINVNLHFAFIEVRLRQFLLVEKTNKMMVYYL